MASALCAFMAIVFQRLMFRVSRLRQDCRKIAGRRPEEHYAFSRSLLEAPAKPPRSLREATAKPPRSNVHAPPLGGPATFPSPEAQCLCCRLSSPPFARTQLDSTTWGASVRDVCGTNIREARRSHSAKPQSCREASRSQPFHKLWPREAPRVASPAVYKP